MTTILIVDDEAGTLLLLQSLLKSNGYAVKTAGEPVRVERVERRFGRLTFVTFALKDANGRVCPNADRALSFATRPGTRLVSLCNGDATSREDFKGMSMRTFHGLLVATVEGPAEGLDVR